MVPARVGCYLSTMTIQKPSAGEETFERRRAAAPHDLAIVIVSTNEAAWLRPCLTTIFERAGEIQLDVVVADNRSTDGTRELVEREFPAARVVTCENRGFAHANNRGAMTCDARYILFLNPDTEVLEGTFADLVSALDARPEVGLVGVKQVTADGVLSPTIRRFPHALRTFGEALGSERMPFRADWLGERELRMEIYESERECDWTSGSFMLARREALESSGLMDERFFIYSEEPDLCLRMKKAGWHVRHLPLMTILHHADKAGISDRMLAQDAFARRQYAAKFFNAPHRAMYVGALALRYLLRIGAATRSEAGRQRRAANARALRTLLGRQEPPFGAPSEQAVAIRQLPPRRDDDARDQTASATAGGGGSAAARALSADGRNDVSQTSSTRSRNRSGSVPNGAAARAVDERS
jgi:N-acetylglucosaminyl-diphospho-decaprenol L-rhamnosyltransferase